MALPDFLIVGAAKCGTTSLYNYLSAHDEIYLNKNKEPKYFVSKILDFPLKGKGDDLTEELMVKDFKEYKLLFEEKKPFQITGEASVDYLFYAEEVIPQIKKCLKKDIKIIIMLRNPVERAFSAYKHLLRDVRETESFEKALELEDIRIKQNYEFIWYYKKAGFYYKDVKLYVDNFKHVKILSFDDFTRNTQTVLNEVFEFLGVASLSDIQTDKIFNKTGAPKSKILQKALTGSPDQLSRKVGRFLFPARIRNQIRDYLERKNLNDKKIVLDLKTRKELDKIYEEDLKKIKDDFGIIL